MTATRQTITIFHLCFFLLLLPLPASSHPLCTDSRAPLLVNETLKFCEYSGRTCCDSKEDLQLQRRFESMNVSDPNCSSLLKSILCARCDQFSGELFSGGFFTRPVPILCNSTSEDLCSKVWETCRNVSVFDSPFAPSLQGGAASPVSSNITTLTDLWKSETDFCNAFGGPSDNKSICFNGEPVTVNGTNVESQPPPKGICLEKIGNGSYLNMVAHPDGSDRAFFSSQPGKIWLATLPDQDSGEPMGIEESNPFVDLTDQVNFDTQFGMMGIAFHPQFARNGRFFASFNCDKVKSPGCSGRCACNSDVNCDPSKLPKDDGAEPCRYQAVVAEYTVNGTSPSPSAAKTAKAAEVRRIFTIGLPFTSDHGGQILFGPDGYLYFMTGDGGGSTDPYNLSQNKKSLLGKVLRVDIDTMPSQSDISKLGLWGNYSIPKDNPFQEDADLQSEIWALGLRNPWRCSFDAERPSYFMCADIGKDTYEEVDIITKGGNYGWRIYEGPYLFSALSPNVDNVSSDSNNLIFPVLGYNHSEVNKNEGSASIIGGYFYRSTADPCTYGSYLYADLYAGAMWAGTETPEGSGNFTASEIPFRCSDDSPIKCTTAPGGGSAPAPALGYIFSFGQDNRKDIYLLTSSGVYRVVRPSRCNLACSKENVTASTGRQSPAPSPSSPSDASKLGFSDLNLSLVLFWSLLFISLGMFQGMN